ncbi:hypothetical protein GQ55_4G251200 [Panicum hallii var. hallii]|uniref:Uncharacterized protein n=1 Tax=Panicum hallii var. hallii TaxID=1504633 RepID=A0A2T7E000_9POAL|nr:hypothetical protein GQ55_4G251200 [Panicum hallii var. hallii]
MDLDASHRPALSERTRTMTVNLVFSFSRCLVTSRAKTVKSSLSTRSAKCGVSRASSTALVTRATFSPLSRAPSTTSLSSSVSS